MLTLYGSNALMMSWPLHSATVFLCLDSRCILSVMARCKSKFSSTYWSYRSIESEIGVFSLLTTNSSFCLSSSFSSALPCRLTFYDRWTSRHYLRKLQHACQAVCDTLDFLGEFAFRFGETIQLQCSLLVVHDGASSLQFLICYFGGRRAGQSLFFFGAADFLLSWDFRCLQCLRCEWAWRVVAQLWTVADVQLICTFCW